MDSFKRNIILFATFSISILYMITSANALLENAESSHQPTDICSDELTMDGFNTYIGYPLQNPEFGNQPTVLEFNQIIKNVTTPPTTPHGIVYNKAVLNYGVILYPICFCFWITGNYVHPNPEIHGKLEILANDLVAKDLVANALSENPESSNQPTVSENPESSNQPTVSENPESSNQPTDICSNSLRTDGFNISIGQELNSEEYVNLPTESELNEIKEHVTTPTTPHGIVYNLAIINYNVILYPKVFCLWIAGIYVAKDIYVHNTWKVLIKELDVYINIDKCLDSLNNITIATPYTKAYNTYNTKILNNVDDLMLRVTFCYWIYGKSDISHKQSVNLNYSNLRKELLGDIFNEQCLISLQKDRININQKVGKIWLTIFINRSPDDFKTFNGLEFWSFVCYSVENKTNRPTPKKYCKNYSEKCIRELNF